mmetsp:Transcript_138566/g.430949  ORF Transcript_138566/g.430949 Transcript_138566/m.430949 type:complete len:252 (+) Transcript_138566:303-1058(+)
MRRHPDSRRRLLQRLCLLVQADRLRRGGRGDEASLPLHVADPASDGASAVPPIAPGAIHAVAAGAGALPRLLRGLRLARLPPILGHLEDEPEALPLAPTLVAGAPVLPNAPDARLGRDRGGDARGVLAAANLLERSLASKPKVFGLDVDAPLAGVLPVAARGAALAPCGPVAETTIYRCLLHGAPWTGALQQGDVRAWRDLLRVPQAPSSLALAVCVDAPGAALHTVARARACTPLRPSAELAVFVGRTAL